MPPTANIRKAIYLNNHLWAGVDTSSITGTLRGRGPTPTAISFNLNRYFDTETAVTGATVATKCRHLDNVKLVIVPTAAFAAAPWNGTFPETYDGSGNLQRGPLTGTWQNGNGGICDQFLAWQGIYVEPQPSFEAGGEAAAESFDVTCYDYRWCLGRTNFRTPPIERHIWESGITEAGSTVGWSQVVGSGADDDFTSAERKFGLTKQVAYQFTYNDIIPKCGTQPPDKPWVYIAEHILRTAAANYAASVTDPGSLWAKVPDYSPDFAVNIHVAGLRTGPVGEALVLTLLANDGDYLPLDPSVPLAYPDAFNSQNLADRQFIPDPITISNTTLLNALQQVIDTVGMFDFYMDAFNTLRFIRNTPPREIVTPPDIKTANDFGQVYRARFADTLQDPPASAAELAACNVRANNLVPRAVPEANRVVGQLVGRSKIASNIINPVASSRATDDFAPTFWQTFSETNMRSHVRYNSAHATVRRFSHKVFSVDAQIAVPCLTAFPYSYEDGGQIRTIDSQSTWPGHAIVISKYEGDINERPPGGGNALEVAVWADSGGAGQRWVRYRFYLTYTTSRATVEIKSTNKTGTESQPDFRSEGGHIVQLVGDSYKRFSLIDLVIHESGSSQFKYVDASPAVFVNCYFDIVSSGIESKQRSHFATNSADGDAGAVCAYGMGTMPNAELYTIDSSTPHSDWIGYEEDAGKPTAFPGLGEFNRAVIDAPPLMKSVQDLIPTDTANDDNYWGASWNQAKAALRQAVKSEALKRRQLVTEGTLRLLYDADLRLDHRLCLVGTRDDAKEDADNNYWMRMSAMLAQINQITLDANDELTLEVTTRISSPEFSILNHAARL